MKVVLKQLLIIVFLSGLSACAGSQERADSAADEGGSQNGDCIHEPSIRGYRVLDEQNLIVEASGRRYYHVLLMRRAFGLENNWRIGFRTTTSRICEGFSELVFRGQFDATEAIRVRSVRQLTPEELDDLLIRFGKKEPEIERTPAPREVEGADVEELDPDAGA